MTVPFLDLKTQYASIKTEVDEAVLRVLASSTYVLGPEVEAFEKEFAQRHNVRHAVAVNTGTSALHVALLAAGIKAGDEVITVSMTFIATVSAIRYANATPVFVDIDPVTCTMDVGTRQWMTETDWLPKGDFYWLGQTFLDDWLVYNVHASAGYGREAKAPP